MTTTHLSGCLNFFHRRSVAPLGVSLFRVPRRCTRVWDSLDCSLTTPRRFTGVWVTAVAVVEAGAAAVAVAVAKALGVAVAAQQLLSSTEVQ